MRDRITDEQLIDNLNTFISNIKTLKFFEGENVSENVLDSLVSKVELEKLILRDIRCGVYIKTSRYESIGECLVGKNLVNLRSLDTDGLCCGERSYLHHLNNFSEVREISIFPRYRKNYEQFLADRGSQLGTVRIYPISKAYKGTASYFSLLFEKAKNVRHLVICESFTHFDLIQNLKKLRTLEIHSETNKTAEVLTEELMTSLVNECPKLRTVVMPSVNFIFKDKFEPHFPGLIFVNAPGYYRDNPRFQRLVFPLDILKPLSDLAILHPKRLITLHISTDKIPPEIPANVIIRKQTKDVFLVLVE